MLAFYPRFIRTFDDLPGHVSLLIHSWNGCNMRCYGCHNYDELIAKKPDGHLTPAQVIGRLKDCAGMFDAVIFSGGEFLISGIGEIERFLRQVRRVFPGKIVLFTNGTFPGKLRRLLNENLVDGVHVDMKLPYHCLNPADDRDVLEAILGFVPSGQCLQNMLESVEIVIRHNSRYSQVRTVRYPPLDDEYFAHIRSFVNGLKQKYGSTVPYRLNPFHPPQGAEERS